MYSRRGRSSSSDSDSPRRRGYHRTSNRSPVARNRRSPTSPHSNRGRNLSPQRSRSRSRSPTWRRRMDISRKERKRGSDSIRYSRDRGRYPVANEAKDTKAIDSDKLKSVADIDRDKKVSRAYDVRSMREQRLLSGIVGFDDASRGMDKGEITMKSSGGNGDMSGFVKASTVKDDLSVNKLLGCDKGLQRKTKAPPHESDVEQQKKRIKVSASNAQSADADSTTAIQEEKVLDEQCRTSNVDDVQYDESDLALIENFINASEADRGKTNEGVGDETRLIEERRKKREEITKKYKETHQTSSIQLQEAPARPPTDADVLRLSGPSHCLSVESNGTIPRASTALSKLAIVEGNALNGKKLMRSETLDTITTICSGDVGVPSSGGTDRASVSFSMDAAIESERQLLAQEKSALEEAEKEQDSAGFGGGKITFDMFSASPAVPTAPPTDDKSSTLGTGRRALRESLLEGEDPHLQSNWDDGEGYYKARIGEMVGDRYLILGVVGKGVFSTVLKCVDVVTKRQADINGKTNLKHTDINTKHTVALKMIRNNDTMRRAADKERNILLKIAANDPNNRRYCVRLLNHLDYRNHVVLVFEYQQMNLREALKKFGKDVGINIGAVRMYGRQLFVALRHLMELHVVHADIKLDNILCSGDLKQVKLCDFGSAFYETDTDTDPTPYLVSRFYRAPEIILGMPYDRAIDMWSVCVSLYELFTGHVMFPGRTNNEMLRLMMAVKGRFPNRLLKAHLRSYETMGLEPHFDPDMRFRQYEMDPVTGKSILRLIDLVQSSRDLAQVLRSSKAGADDAKLVSNLTDLLEKGLSLDPAKRLSVNDALRHGLFATTNSSSNNNSQSNSGNTGAMNTSNTVVHAQGT